jgi:hypothetical protein
MGYIRPCVVLTCVTAATFFDRCIVSAIFCIRNANFAVLGIDRAIAAKTSRQNTVEKINAIFDTHKEIFWFTQYRASGEVSLRAVLHLPI